MYCSRLSIHVCGSVNVELKSRDKVAKFCFFDDLANKKFTWLRTRTTQPPPSNMCFSKEMSMSFAIAGLAMSGWVWYRVSSPPSPTHHNPLSIQYRVLHQLAWVLAAARSRVSFFLSWRPARCHHHHTDRVVCGSYSSGPHAPRLC